MKIKVFETREIGSAYAGDLIMNQVKENPNIVLGLATGGTPTDVYKYISETHKEKGVSFKTVRTFNLDEYIGIDETNDQSYRYFMNHHLFNNIDIKISNTRIPDKSFLDNPARYDDLILEHGGIDLQVLGLGINGHVGFNEPPTNPDSKTHVEYLTESTINVNKRFFNSVDDVPRSAITMGITTILKSRKIILLVFGKSKEQPLKTLLSFKKPDINFPASFLINHEDCLIIADKEAYGEEL